MGTSKIKKTTQKERAEKKTNSISPFKDHLLFEKEIQEFANKYKTIVVNQAKRTSDYFEMSCYNCIVRHYENIGFETTIRNLQSGKYKYKCTPSGIQSNFSYFVISTKIEEQIHTFELQHNLAVQSSQDDEVFTTPDIAIIKEGKVKYTKEYYDTKTTFSYVENKDLMSFCEVKQFNPYPELLFNFIGVLNELKSEYMDGGLQADFSLHIAPSLMISGKPNKQTKRIRESLEKRYGINIFYDLIWDSKFAFSKDNSTLIRKAKKTLHS